jgi:hypothetical protein
MPKKGYRQTKKHRTALAESQKSYREQIRESLRIIAMHLSSSTPEHNRASRLKRVKPPEEKEKKEKKERRRKTFGNYVPAVTPIPPSAGPVRSPSRILYGLYAAAQGLGDGGQGYFYKMESADTAEQHITNIKSVKEDYKKRSIHLPKLFALIREQIDPNKPVILPARLTMMQKDQFQNEGRWQEIPK